MVASSSDWRSEFSTEIFGGIMAEDFVPLTIQQYSKDALATPIFFIVELMHVIFARKQTVREFAAKVSNEPTAEVLNLCCARTQRKKLVHSRRVLCREAAA
ncbi:hypothetical protein KIN_22380 [Litoreibacter roseus]|uniref:Uncharacterized protein n=1 Tax=Litoreibacter roseus TaxID=2601869 RepID=A0A6N6JGB5_9RHOB|nr:hypothetical protein KIN_22380 [Litoreibacter roseus]